MAAPNQRRRIVKEDGYERDQNVFGPGVIIEDDTAVLIGYRCGATMTYHLTAYSPWQGYRIAFNAAPVASSCSSRRASSVTGIPASPPPLCCTASTPPLPRECAA
jgi:hypothetical protein